MKRTSILNATVVIAILTTALLAAPASAQTVSVAYSWTAPTTGSAVTSYVIQQSIDGGTWAQVATSSTTSYTLAATTGHSHRIRVAGVDAQARQGVWSDPSDPYTADAGVPGQPGKPTRI